MPPTIYQLCFLKQPSITYCHIINFSVVSEPLCSVQYLLMPNLESQLCTRLYGIQRGLVMLVIHKVLYHLTAPSVSHY